MVNIGLYIHIPFCLKKCFYCDFNSIPVLENNKNQKLIKRYMNALYMEIERCMVFSEWKNYQVKSIFFGGGTPSLVDAEEIGETLKVCKKVFKIAEDTEVTIEANPGTVSYDSLKNYLKSGINRISLGCQSFDDEELKKIGRVHSKEDIYRSIGMAREAGFENISIDLIFGIPGQSLESFKSSLGQGISLKPQHISLYNLTIEENTFFNQLVEDGKLRLPEEDEQVGMYEYGIESLSKNGYEHYEISNFALKGKRCLHNENYWRGVEYLGFGAGAHSFRKVSSFEFQVSSSDCRGESMTRKIEARGKGQGARVVGKRWWNVKDVRRYCDGAEDSLQRKDVAVGFSLRKKACNVIEGEEMLGEDKHIAEAIMLGLRMMEGIDTKEFFNNHGVLIEEKYGKEIEELKKNKLLELKNGRLRLTHKGILFSDEIFLKFMP